VPERIDALILDSRERGSLAVARALGPHGYRLAMGGYGARDPGLFTRYAHLRALFTPPGDDIDSYAQEIVDWLSEHPCDAVIASSDQTATALERRRADLEQLTGLGVPPSRALEISLDKHLTLEAAERCGVPTPRTVEARDTGDVLAAAAELGYPCVLKPLTSWRMLDETAGVRVVSALLVDDEDARRHAAELLGDGRVGLVQEYATGRREAITVFRHDGRLTAAFGMAASRTWPPLGGSSVMRMSIPLPEDSLRHADALTEEIGYAGYGEVEFRRTADGRPLIMEINPRFSASVELALRAGVDFASMQLEWARGREPEPSNGYRLGVRLSWFAGEMRLLGNRLVGAPQPRTPFHRMLGAVARDYLPPPRIDGIDRHDVKPTLRAVTKGVADAVDVLSRRRSSPPGT
jgi:predicted ATP-grasp superfamily ATP-dependent carboligase